MRKTHLTAALLAALILPALAQADDGAWSGTGEFGLAVAKGNTDTQTLVAKLGMTRESGDWKHSAGAAMLFGKADGVENARRWNVFGSTGHRLSENSYLFGNARMERDSFGSYEYQSVASAGYGYEAIRTDSTQLTFEVGPGYRWSKFQGVRQHENGAVLRGMADFKHAFNDSTSIYNLLTVEAGSANTFVRNDTGVMVKMTDALALKAGVEVRHNTDVLPGRKKTDTLSTINVVYGF